MKIRTGYVSNSSSTSFVIVGFETPYSEFNFNAFPKDPLFTYVIKDSTVIAGIMLARGEDNLSESQTLYPELIWMHMKIKEAFEIEDSVIKLITGVHQ